VLDESAMHAPGHHGRSDRLGVQLRGADRIEPARLPGRLDRRLVPLGRLTGPVLALGPVSLGRWLPGE
jgi:hypothetical protein